MKTKRLEYICEVLAEQVNHWMLFPLAMTIIGISAKFMGIEIESPGIVMWIFCSLFPLFFFLLREKIKRFSFFVLLHLVTAALSLLIPVQNNVERMLCIACAVGYMIYSFSRRMKDRKSITEPAVPPVGLGISIVSLFLQNTQGKPGWDSFYVIALVAVFALYSLHSYISHYLEFLTVNESSAGYLPASDMFHSGMGLVAGYTLVGTVILLLGSGGSWVIPLRNMFRGLLLTVLRFLFSLIPTGEQGEAVTTPPPDTAPMEFGAMSGEPESSIFWSTLEAIVAVAMVCGMVYLVVKGLVLLVKFIRKQFGEDFTRKQKIARDYEMDVREKCAIEKKREQKEKRSVFGFLTPAERVRKLYKKKVLASSFDLSGGLKGENSPKLELLTARECAGKLQIESMADLYEKARYSDQEITRENVRQMRDVCK